MSRIAVEDPQATGNGTLYKIPTAENDIVESSDEFSLSDLLLPGFVFEHSNTGIRLGTAVRVFLLPFADLNSDGSISNDKANYSTNCPKKILR